MLSFQTLLRRAFPNSQHGDCSTRHPMGEPALGSSWRSVIAQPILLLPHPHRWEDGPGQGKEVAKLVVGGGGLQESPSQPTEHSTPGCPTHEVSLGTGTRVRVPAPPPPAQTPSAPNL